MHAFVMYTIGKVGCVEKAAHGRPEPGGAIAKTPRALISGATLTRIWNGRFG